LGLGPCTLRALFSRRGQNNCIHATSSVCRHTRGIQGRTFAVQQVAEERVQGRRILSEPMSNVRLLAQNQSASAVPQRPHKTSHVAGFGRIHVIVLVSVSDEEGHAKQIGRKKIRRMLSQGRMPKPFASTVEETRVCLAPGGPASRASHAQETIWIVRAK
jgi:hypothetical protein